MQRLHGERREETGPVANANLDKVNPVISAEQHSGKIFWQRWAEVASYLICCSTK